jgi:primary-amine oxidase
MNLHLCFIFVCSVNRTLISIAAVMFAVAHPMWPQSPRHPLDGLTAPEIWTAYEVLHQSGKVDEKTQYPMVQLKEAPKEEVLAWKLGQAMRREAFLVVKEGAQTFEAVVDVNGKKLLSWTERKGVQPNMTNEEVQGIDGSVKASPEVQAALKRRGITDLATVACGVYALDYFGAAQRSGRRLVHVTCSQQYGPEEEVTGNPEVNCCKQAISPTTQDGPIVGVIAIFRQLRSWRLVGRFGLLPVSRLSAQ